MSKGPPGRRKFLECTRGIRIHGHGRPLGSKNQDPNFGQEIRSLMDKRSIRDLFLKFPQGDYGSQRSVSLATSADTW